METVSNATTEQTALTGEKQDDSDDEDEGNIDLGVAGLPQVNFSGLKNEFQTINLDGDGDDEEEDEPSDRDLSDDKRKKKYRKKKKKNQPSENSSDSSSDDDRRSSRKKKETEIDPSDLTWPLWVWYYIVAVSSGALKVAEYLGEKLAAFFGITTPRYQYVIDEFYRLKEQEREEEEQERREREYVERMAAERLASLEGGNSLDLQKAAELLNGNVVKQSVENMPNKF